MTHILKINKLPFAYILIKKRGLKYVRVRIKEGKVFVSAPYLVSKKRIELFLFEKAEWIQEKIELAAQNASSMKYGSYSTHAKRAKKLIKERVEHYNAFCKFSYNRISIKQHETRWGSCSRKRNLNFNYRLFFLPLELVDYVVVHELSHLQEFNHSKNFWKLVELQIPDYKQRRMQLKHL